MFSLTPGLTFEVEKYSIQLDVTRQLIPWFSPPDDVVQKLEAAQKKLVQKAAKLTARSLTDLAQNLELLASPVFAL